MNVGFTPITGHSLGGALAALFAASVCIGSRKEMNDSLKKWPWKSCKVITYGAPVVGDSKFAKVFNSHIYCRGFLLGEDVISKEILHSKVGIEIKLKADRSIINLPGNHEPLNIRNSLIEYLQRWNKPGGVPTEGSSSARSPLEKDGRLWCAYDTLGKAIHEHSRVKLHIGTMCEYIKDDAQEYIEAWMETLKQKGFRRRPFPTSSNLWGSNEKYISLMDETKKAKSHKDIIDCLNKIDTYKGNRG